MQHGANGQRHVNGNEIEMVWQNSLADDEDVC